MTQRVRIFVSSPGDTQFERMRIDRVVERLNGEFAGVARLEAIRWELEFYKAHATFQQQIPEAADCDIVIAILRHRLGTALPDDFTRMPNNEPYPSGTAYEILTAIDAGRKRGLPDVYVFRYPESPTVRLDDAATNALVTEQWERLKNFFKTWFQTPAGQFKAAFQEFRSTDVFEEQVEELLRKWLADKILKGRPVVWPIATKGSPFCGLASFGSQHAAVFFGRSRDITKAIDALKDASERGVRFLLVVGPSGAGKSSLAHAGLVPRLTTPGVIPAVDGWRVALTRPSASPEGPVVALAQCLFQGSADTGADGHGQPRVLPEIRDSDYGTPRALAELLAHADETSVRPILHALDRAGEAERKASGYDRPVRIDLLLVVDQLDELFAQDVPEQRRNSFTRLLCALVATNRVWVIATLRADLYERLLDNADLLELKTRGATYDLAPPGAAELAEIVRRPAEAAGLIYETDPNSGERLDDRLLMDAERPDMLPLLQFTLSQLFEQRETVDAEVRLTFAAYKLLGGLAGAIDKEAERAVAALGDAERERLPRMLRQLAGPAQGSDSARDAARLTARSVPYSEAAYDEPSTQLVRALIEARILLTSGGGERATVRLAHQRVLESWKRAQQIVAANADFYRVREEVEDQQRRWESSGRKRDLLIPAGLPLAEAESIRERYAGELPQELNEYIDASSERGRLRQRRQQTAVAAFALLAVIAGAAGLWAVKQQRQAEESLRVSRTSTSRFLADLARQKLDEGRVGDAVAFARQAVPLEIKDWPRVKTAENALALAMQAYSSAFLRPVVGYIGHEGGVRGVEFSRDGTRLLTWSYDATARVWDVETGAQVKVLSHDDGVRGAHFSSDGRRVLSWSFDGKLRLWTLAGNDKPIEFAHESIVLGAAFSADEKRILSWSYDGTARIWESANGRQIAAMKHQGVVREARFFDSERRILTRAADDSAGIWNAADGTLVAMLTHASDVRGAVLFAQETRVLTWSDDKSARLWDSATGRELLRLEHAGRVSGVLLSSDESRLLTWSDKLAQLWDLKTGKKLARFEHDRPVIGATLSTSASRVLSWSDRTVRLWNAASGALIGQTGHSDRVIGAKFSPDEKQVLSWSYDGTAQLWSDVEDTVPQRFLLRHEGAVRNATFLPGGAWAWTRSDDGTARLWSVRRAGVGMGRDTVVLRHQAEVLGLLYSPNANRMVTYSADGTARLWDLPPQDAGSLQLRRDDFTALPLPGKALGALFSDDSQTLLTWSADDAVRLWDVANGKQTLLLKHAAAVQGAAFAPGHGPILTWSADGVIRFWDRNSGKPVASFKGQTAVRGATYSPQNDRLLAWFQDGEVALWNSKSQKRLAQFARGNERVPAVFSRDGRYALIASADGTLRTLDSDQAKLIGTMTHPEVSGSGFSPDGARLLSWSDDGAVRVWDLHGGKPLAEMRHAGSVFGAVFSPDGERVLSWADENAAKIWDARTGKELTALRHTAVTHGALFDGDGSHVWTWSNDGSARLWQSATGAELLRLQHGDTVIQGTLVLDGRFLFTQTNGRDRNLRLWDTATGDLVASFSAASHSAVASDARHFVTWQPEFFGVLTMPLWTPTEVLAARASRITERLKPLSRLARCHAYIETSGCDRIPATTERELALIGDGKHMRLSAPSASRNTGNWMAPDAKVEIAANEVEAFVFHDQPFLIPIQWLEFNRSTTRLAFRLKDGSARDFGIAIDPRAARLLETADRVLVVRMEPVTRKPLEGLYYPLLVY